MVSINQSLIMVTDSAFDVNGIGLIHSLFIISSPCFAISGGTWHHHLMLFAKTSSMSPITQLLSKYVLVGA